MKKIYCLLFAMLPLAAWAGEVKVTKPEVQRSILFVEHFIGF